MNRAKQRGTAWETAIVQYLIEAGFVGVERRTLSGSKDKGDIAGLPGLVVEAKCQQHLDLGGWVNELLAEIKNADASLGAVWAKRKGKGSPGDGYVIMTGALFVELLKKGRQ